MGAKIMLRRNVCTADGLVNGVMGTIVGFEWPQGHRALNTQPCGFNVLFDDKKVSRLTRNSMEHTPTTLRPVLTTFKSQQEQDRTERCRSPIVLAWAVTRCKGPAWTELSCIDLGGDVFAHGMAYVALSSVKSLEGVCVVGLTKEAL